MHIDNSYIHSHGLPIEPKLSAINFRFTAFRISLSLSLTRTTSTNNIDSGDQTNRKIVCCMKRIQTEIVSERERKSIVIVYISTSIWHA